jgi:hypothetical protein
VPEDLVLGDEFDRREVPLDSEQRGLRHVTGVTLDREAFGIQSPATPQRPGRWLPERRRPEGRSFLLFTPQILPWRHYESDHDRRLARVSN